MATPEKPQPSEAQVKLVDAVIRVLGATKAWVKPAMYGSGSMLLVVITEGGQMRVGRFDQSGDAISLS